MKGNLVKTEKGWVVNYHYSVNKNDWETLLLHPECGIPQDAMCNVLDNGFAEVEFEIVTEWETGEVGVNGLTYAKLLHHSVDSNKMINHIGDANKMVEDDVWKAGLEDELNKLPYTKHLDDGQYNDGQLSGFELGATWGFNKAKEKSENPINLFTMEDMLKCWNTAYVDAMSIDEYDYKPTFFEDFIQSLKQPKQ